MVDLNTSDIEIKKGLGDAENTAKRVSFGMLPLPPIRLVIWVNIALSLVIAIIGFGVGFGEGTPLCATSDTIWHSDRGATLSVA